jgi:hypothetical protein
MHDIKMFDRSGALNLEGFSGSNADWLERYKPYIEDGKTVVCRPHKRSMARRTTTWFFNSANGVLARSSWGACRRICVSSLTFANCLSKAFRLPW